MANGQQKSMVSFTIETPTGLQSRSMGDGTTATRLNYAVYESGTTTPLIYTSTDNPGSISSTASSGHAVPTVTMENKRATVNLQLATGLTYDVIFWADAPTGSPYTFDPTSQSIKVDYTTNCQSNDENRDAFFGHQTIQVTQDASITVLLKRPFAQLNIGASDFEAAQIAGVVPTETQVAVALPNTLNLMTGEVSGTASEKRVFKQANIPADAEAFPVTGNRYLAMNYLLVGDARQLVDIDFTVYRTTGAVKTTTFGSVPVQRNYRTNIYGSVLTSMENVTVTIEPEFEQPDIVEPIIMSTIADVNSALNSLPTGDVAYKIQTQVTGTTGNTLTIPATVNASTVPSVSYSFADIANDAQFEVEASNYTGDIVLEVPENSTINEQDITVNAPNATVTFLKGSYRKVITTTGSNTFIVGNGTTIETLSVTKGNVRIENGGTVDNIERSESNADELTYVTIANGGTLTNPTTDPKIIVISVAPSNVELNGQYNFPNVSDAVVYAQQNSIKNMALVLQEGEYKWNDQLTIAADESLTIQAAQGVDKENVIIDGFLLLYGSVKISNVTVKHSIGSNSNTISQFQYTPIALENQATFTADNAIFSVTKENNTAITAWWSNGEKGTQITVKNSVFNCSGQRPIRSDANVTVENCIFNDPYRYCIQTTAKTSTVTGEGPAVINFRNNTIHAGTTTDKPVYGIQLEGEDYGCSNLTINGSGNTIDLGDTGKTAAMYYCECAKVDHHTVNWNVECPVVHNPEYYITTKEGLKAFAEAVNNGTSYQGKTIYLGADIDMAGEEWTPINPTIASYPSKSFYGTFDGQGHTIRNLKAESREVNYAAAGLFGCLSGTVKNLTLENITISSTHYAGGIAGYFSNSRITEAGIYNCHVIGGTVTSECELLGEKYDNGDKVGGIMGYAAAPYELQDCTVTNVAIQGYRDLGGILGYSSNSTVTNCQVKEGVTITVDNTHNYKSYTSGTEHDANHIIGENQGTITGCTGEATIHLPDYNNTSEGTQEE